MNKDIRILLVGDHELARYGLRRMLEQEEDIEVMGDYANAEEALPQVRMLSPDIVLMDAQMPEMNGIEATRHLQGLDYDGDVIILAESMNYRAEALKAGAAGYLLKDITCTELAQTIREVYWNKQLPQDFNDLVEEAVELVVPPAANAAWLFRFMCQLAERLNDNDDYTSLMHTAGSWDWGTVITLTLQLTSLATLLKKLEDMPEVEKVEEESTVRDSFPDLPKKFRVLPSSSTCPSKRIRVTLKETCATC